MLRQRRAGAVAVAGERPEAAPRCCHQLQLKWLKMKKVKDFRRKQTQNWLLQRELERPEDATCSSVAPMALGHGWH